MGLQFLWVNYLIIFFLFAYGIFIQNISNINKKSVFYGVRIPIEYGGTEKLNSIHRNYQKRLVICFIIFNIILTLINLKVSDELKVVLLLPEIFSVMALIALNYLAAYNKVLKLSNDEKWDFDGNVVIVDTNFRAKGEDKKRAVISIWWYAIPLSLMLITWAGIVINALRPFQRVLTESTVRWGSGGLFAVMTVAVVQLILNLIFIGTHKWTEKTKQSLNGGKVSEIKNRSRQIRYNLSAAYLILAIFINLQLMMMGFSMCGIFSTSLLTNGGLMITSFLIPVLMVIAVIVKSARGSDNQISKGETGQQVINRKDDQYYKFGVFYYNKNDPALFVEKRMGIGATLNLARPAAKIFAGIIAVLLIGVTVMLFSLPGMTKERQVHIKPDCIEISGAWGFTISRQEIDRIAFEDEMPEIIAKTNGADIGEKLYGNHNLKGYSKSVLFIGDKSKKFISMYLKDGRLILINYEDESKTYSIYKEIIGSLNIR